MSAFDFAARAQAREAVEAAEMIGAVAERAQATASKADDTAQAALTASDRAREAVTAFGRDIESAQASAQSAGQVAQAADGAARAANTAALQAEQLAKEAVAAAPRLFAGLVAARLPASVTMVSSNGFAELGMGAATYISDGQATADLVKAHPLACFTGDAGRCFRLLPDAQGYITPEQMGCPIYAPGVNARSYIQAAIDYAHAMKAFGIKGVAFGQEKYELWTPFRTPTQPNGGPGDYTGFPILIRKKIALKAAANGTELIRKKWNGRDPAEWNTAVTGGTAQPLEYVNPNTNIARGGYTWRGGMITLVHKPRISPPATPHTVMDYTDLAGVAFQGRWKLNGGIPRSTFMGQYCPQGDQYSSGKLEPATGFGWDWSDKPIWFSNLGWTGDVTFDHLEIVGYRGEMIYQGGELHGSIRGRRLILEESDANGLNPGPIWCEDGKAGRVEIEHLTIRNCFQAFEGGSGRGIAHMGVIELIDCNKGGILHPGDYNQDPMTMPVKPILTIDRVISSCTGLVEKGLYNSSYEVAFFTHIGEIIATDCSIAIGSAQGNCYDSTVGRITMIAHKAGYTVDFKSLTTGGNNYALHRSQDCLVGEIVHQRTPYARANNISASSGFLWTNSDYGPNIRVGKLSGAFGSTPQSSAGTAAPVAYTPILEDLTGIALASGIGWNIETTPSLGVIHANFQRLTTTTSVAGTVFPVTLPAPSGKYDRGFRFKMAHYVNNCIVSVATTNTRMPKRLIMLPSQEYEFISNGSAWVPVTASGMLTGSVAATLQKAGAPIPAGDVSDEVTLTIRGVRAGMDVRVTPSAAVPADAQLIGRVAGDDTIAIRVRNLNMATPLTMPNMTVRVAAEWGS
jgi:hypothetical protein